MRVLIAASLGSSLLNFRGELIRSLLQRGVDVHVAAPDLDGDLQTVSTLLQWGVSTHHVHIRRTGLNPLSDLLSLVGFIRLMMRIKPAGFLGYTAKPVIYGVLAARLSGVESRVALITGLGYAFQGGRERAVVRGVVKGLYRVAMACATVAVFQNPDDERTFRDLRLISPRLRSEVVNGSGVDLDRFRSEPLPVEHIRFLMIGRLLKEKGVREFVEAAAALRKERQDVHFILVGPLDTNPDSVTHSELSTWITSGVIDYRGELRDVRPALRDCTVYVLPSYREGTPRSVLEAMATGRPIITTDAPGCRETVENGVNGFLVPVRSAEAVAEAMRRFLRDPELVRRMAEASIVKVREKYDVRKVNDRMLEIMGAGRL